jgi:hypothetical protein
LPQTAQIAGMSMLAFESVGTVLDS